MIKFIKTRLLILSANLPRVKSKTWYFSLLFLTVNLLVLSCNSSKAELLNIEQNESLKLEEVSGLGWRKNPQTLELLAVGDQTFKILVSNWSSNFSNLKFKSFDLSEKMPSETRKKAVHSNWEAVASDLSGSVFVLEENPGAVYIFNSEIDQLIHTIQLVVSSDDKLAKQWRSNPNSRGEGFVLLKNGHILLLKEKESPVIIEFGQEGEKPQGYSIGDAVGFDNNFPLPPGTVSSFVPLKVWQRDQSSKYLMTDLSEIAVGQNGALYLLSEESRKIGRIQGGLLLNQDEFHLEMTWNLPDKIKVPEGLVLTETMSPVVAVDNKNLKKNLFFLSSIR